mmetsp:Transcript_47028/g.124974  ORF Transcript_47028/g.124974 Transcript_47028/m.124974 type:complete len:173 (+) Transcript_47028:1496-2014(+)
MGEQWRLEKPRQDEGAELSWEVGYWGCRCVHGSNSQAQKHYQNATWCWVDVGSCSSGVEGDCVALCLLSILCLLCVSGLRYDQASPSHRDCQMHLRWHQTRSWPEWGSQLLSACHLASESWLKQLLGRRRDVACRCQTVQSNVWILQCSLVEAWVLNQLNCPKAPYHSQDSA